jgi:transposase
MFVKQTWNTVQGKRYERYFLVESYRDAESGQPRHRYLINLSRLPQHAIKALAQSLKQGKTAVGAALSSVKISIGDGLRGAGFLSVWRAWQKWKLPRLLAGFTPAEQQSVLAMVAGRILAPSSKLALKVQLADTLLAQAFSRTRLDEDELYRVMDKLHQHFYTIQQRLQTERAAAPVLCLYDLTSTYFEGTRADEGAYGHSRDKRWDRYQIVIGLVCDEEGLPVAVEVWPGNTADRSTLRERVRTLKEQFGIEKAIFVGDVAVGKPSPGSLYSQTNIQTLEELGLDYILRVDWQTQRTQLEGLAPEQQELFDRQGVVEWVENGACPELVEGVRYVGCVSEYRRERAARRREKGMQKAQEQLEGLARTAARGCYYSWVTLRQKVDVILDKAGVAGLWRIEIAYRDAEAASPEEKARLALRFAPDQEALSRRMALEGTYVLRTSLGAEQCSPQQVDSHYRRLQYAERAFRHIKSYLKLRPIYHYKRRRIRAHVLICFLAFYLVKQLELELRAAGEPREVELLLRRWDQLKVCPIQIELGKERRTEWQWTLGEVGKGIQQELQKLGWWNSVEAYRRSLLRSLTS